MINMKKTLILILICLIGSSFIFATTPQLEYDGATNFSFMPTSARMGAMGGAGLATAGRIDSLYLNPAALAERRFALSIPSISVTAYNLNALVQDEDDAAIIQSMFDGGEMDEGDLLTLATDMIGNLGSGYNELLTTDAKVAFALGGLAVGVDFQEKLHSIVDFNSVSTPLSVKIVPEVNIAGTLGYGARMINTRSFNLDLGVSAHLVYKMYMKQQTGSSILSLMSDETEESAIVDTYLLNTPVMGGYAIPVDAGITAGFMNNSLRASVVVRDINSVYKMTAYPGAGTLIQEVLGEEIDGSLAMDEEPTTFEITTPMTVDAGFAFNPEWRVMNPTLAFDVVDVLGLMEEFSAGSFSSDDFMLHVNAGVSVKLLGILDLRAGINQGYLGAGVGFGLLGLRVEASYYVREYGLEVGDKPVDALTLRFNLGQDK